MWKCFKWCWIKKQLEPFHNTSTGTTSSYWIGPTVTVSESNIKTTIKTYTLSVFRQMITREFLGDGFLFTEVWYYGRQWWGFVYRPRKFLKKFIRICDIFFCWTAFYTSNIISNARCCMKNCLRGSSQTTRTSFTHRYRDQETTCLIRPL